MTIADHQEDVPLFVTKLSHYSYVSGQLWLRYHNVNIWFLKKIVTFDSDFYHYHYCKNRNSTYITSISIPLLEKQKLRIIIIAGSKYTNLVKIEQNVVAMVSATVYQIDHLLGKYDKDRACSYAASLGHIKREENKISEEEKNKQLMPKEYHDFVLLFKKAITNI